MWHGKAETLKKKTIIKHVSDAYNSIDEILKSKIFIKYFTSKYCKLPHKPKIIELPNNKIPFEMPPKTKYLIVASIEVRL